MNPPSPFLCYREQILPCAEDYFKFGFAKNFSCRILIFERMYRRAVYVWVLVFLLPHLFHNVSVCVMLRNVWLVEVAIRSSEINCAW